MIVRAARTFGRDSPVHAYWLTCCKGFSVRANGRTVGVVEEIVCAEPISPADALVVRRRGVLGHQRMIPADRVEAVVPAERALLLAAPSAAPKRQPVIRPWLAALARGVTRGLALGMRLSQRLAVRAAPVLRRLARASAVLLLRLLGISARAIVRAMRAARARAPVVRRSLARLAASSYRLR